MITLLSGVIYLNKDEVCKFLDISKASLNRLVAGNQIPHVKVKSLTGSSRQRVMFVQTDIDAWASTWLKSPGKNN